MYVLVKYFIYNNTIMELDQEKGRKWSQILPAFVGKKKIIYFYFFRHRYLLMGSFYAGPLEG